ncbi:PTS sugar transporter subunit IIA [Romboutsia sp.]|uniref:PTS sugar transporter subunit IIA n=1 Tax=Romboutsia sp. TaxID=1965302 RepID=UPI002C4B7FD7|nr:PTS sugar transporter subunit IIA [Romboutsia sp.]HSQ89708.1 PTS sugar transporter subunit IIA [Romboutsia sp.]
MLRDILTEDMIQINIATSNWEEAIKQSAKPLEVGGKITKQYTDSMIKAIKDLGPYIVIMPGIALAHARPGDSVKEDSIALTTLSEPVYFGSKHNDPVHTIFTFATKSEKGHLRFIQNLAMFLSEDSNIEKLKESNSKQEILQIIKKSSIED